MNRVVKSLVLAPTAGALISRRKAIGKTVIVLAVVSVILAGALSVILIAPQSIIHQATETSISTTVSITTITLTTTSQLQYPVTFDGAPAARGIEALCINATLVSHLGENLTVLLSALFQNATTGRNATINGSNDSMYYATRYAKVANPSHCYLIAYPVIQGTCRVIVFVSGTDGKTVLSPSTTITIRYGSP